MKTKVLIIAIFTILAIYSIYFIITSQYDYPPPYKHVPEKIYKVGNIEMYETEYLRMKQNPKRWKDSFDMALQNRVQQMLHDPNTKKETYKLTDSGSVRIK